MLAGLRVAERKSAQFSTAVESSNCLGHGEHLMPCRCGAMLEC